MRLSFSNRGWNEVSWEELQKIAADMGFAGIEVYNLHQSEELIGRGAPFHKYNTQATARALRENGLEIPVFDTSIDLSMENGGTGNERPNADSREECLATVRALMDVAKNIQGISAMNRNR